MIRSLDKDQDDLEGARAELGDLEQRVEEIVRRRGEKELRRLRAHMRGPRLVTRYLSACAITVIVSAVYGAAFGLVIYYVFYWFFKPATPSGQPVLTWELPGPFSGGWLNHAVWFWALFMMLALPHELIKAVATGTTPT